MKKIFISFFVLPFSTFAQIDSTCYLVPDIGPCFGAFIKYYYDQNTNTCKSFTWGGCDGVVPFNTLQECENACQNGAVSIETIRNKNKREVLYILNALGQHTVPKKNILLFYVFSDGTVQKRIIIK
ncbi:BPTI/Kunitz domain-containing protein [Aureispira]|nr:BPTI/Kunitz domain-containing protein [Aureispira sp.]